MEGSLEYTEDMVKTIATDGDVSYWFQGNALALFFHTENDAEVSSGVIPFGCITSDLSVFMDMQGNESITVRLSSLFEEKE